VCVCMCVCACVCVCVCVCVCECVCVCVCVCRYYLRLYESVFSGSDLVDWLLDASFRYLKKGLEEQTAVSSIHVEFVNNTARTAGYSLYGGYLDDCQGLGLHVSGFDVFKKIFHYKSSHSDLSVISSDPLGVCFCFSTDALMPYCCMDSNCKKSVSMYNVMVYPGETSLYQ